MTDTVGREAEPPLVNIVGELVALGPMRRELLSLYQRWINDFGAIRNMGVPRPLTHEQEVAWYDRTVTATDDIQFTIYERATWRPVGNTGLHHIDHRNRTAEFGIIIGEADCRGKGYGTEAARLMLDYGFTALGLFNVMLRVHAFNLAGQRAYQKAGFREWGRRRHCVFMGGRWWDEVYMDCLASEFISPVLSRVLGPDQPRT